MNSTINPWTERQWQKHMRDAGWKNTGQGCWIHNETGAQFMAWTVTKKRIDKYGRGEAWFEFALNRELPTEAPF